MPEETEEEKRAAQLKKLREEEEKKAALEGESKTKTRKPKETKPADEEEKKEEAKKEPPKPIKVQLYQTSIHDLINSLDKMQDYDFILNDLGIVTADLTEERLKLSGNDLKDGNARQKV